MKLHSVAPKELLRADYEVLKSYEHLETTKEIEDLLFIQSLEGRAHNGAGVFNKRVYVNTTIDDVVQALDLNTNQIKMRRQKLVDDIYDYAYRVMDGERCEKLMNDSGEPFLGIPLFRDRHVNSRDVLRGLYMGGFRDNPDIRKEAERIYNTKIGGGRCYIVDIRKMIDMNLDGDILANEAHEDKIDDYYKQGLIIATEGIPDEETQRYFYIRHRIGPGQSDDAAMIMAGILYNADVALGIFLADAIDTLEKYAPVCKDQDGSLSFQIGRGLKDLNLSMNDVYELVWLCSIPEPEEDFVPDSSLRYLLSIDQRSGQCAFKTHLDFVEGKPIVSLPISFKKILSTQFYEYINRRLANVQKFEKLVMPNLTVTQMDKPAAEIMKKEFTVIQKDASISDVVKKFKETKAEILIVQDKNSKVVGTITAADLLHLLDGGFRGHART